MLTNHCAAILKHRSCRSYPTLWWSQSFLFFLPIFLIEVFSFWASLFLSLFFFFLPTCFSVGVWYCSTPQLLRSFAWKMLYYIYFIEWTVQRRLKTVGMFLFSFSLKWKVSRETATNTHLPYWYMVLQATVLFSFWDLWVSAQKGSRNLPVRFKEDDFNTF